MTTTELRRKLFRRMLKKVVAPALVGSEDLDQAVDYLKTCVVDFGDRRDLPKDAIAFHFGKSDRWVYNYLEHLKIKRKARPPVVRHIKPVAPPPEEGDGYRQMVAVVTHLMKVYPAALSPEELGREFKIASEDLRSFSSLLGLYADAELIEMIDTVERVTFRARRPQGPTEAPQDGLNWDLVDQKLELIWPLVLGYAQRDEGAEFGDLVGEVTEEAYERLRQRVRGAVAEAYADALEESVKADPRTAKMVRVRALFAMGKTRAKKGVLS